MTLTPPYRDLPSAYFLHVYLSFQTWRNRQVLQGVSRETFDGLLAEICERCAYHLLALRLCDNRVELVLSLRTQQAVSDVLRKVKGNLSRGLFLAHPELEGVMGRRKLWAGSYRAETTGAASTAQVKAYIDDQRAHHRLDRTGRDAFLKVGRYAAPDRASYQQFEKSAHAVYRLHYHFVLSVKGQRVVIDEALADYLTEVFLRVGEAKGYQMLAFDILEEHVHLLLAARPTEAPQDMAEGLMNNSSVMALRRFPALVGRFPYGQLWTPGFFVRSVGRTTAQVKAALRVGHECETPDVRFLG